MQNDPVAIVMGAARGIGAATVQLLSESGYQVIAMDACLGSNLESMPGVTYNLGTPEELESVSSKCSDRIHPVIVDARDHEALNIQVQQIRDRFGRIDVAVAAAAVISGGKPQWETSQAELQTLIETDFVGVWNLAAATIPHMLSSTRPDLCRFIAIASAAGSHGLLHLSGYSAVKHAVIGLIKGIAADLEGTGVSAIAVSPGSTDTDMLRASADLYSLSDVKEFVASSRLRRLLAPEEIAHGILFCCTPAGSALNGSTLDMSGGFKG